MVVDETRTRLLEAGGEEFAEKGFEKATVRSICDRAQVKNLAAVSYYFGSKEGLYEEALLQAHRCGADLFEIPHGPAHSPHDQLRVYIRVFLTMILGQADDQAWHQRLMIREMIQPTPAIDVLVREMIRPRFEWLLGILRNLEPGAEPRQIHATAFSIIGQCLHYKFARQVNQRLLGEEAYARLDVEFLSQHIAQFSLAALGLGAPLGTPTPTSIRSESN